MLNIMFSSLTRRLTKQPAVKHKRYLVSTAGLPNLGDEFITRAWLQYLARYEPESDIWLDCSNPSHASLLFKDIHPHLHVVNTLWQLVWNTQHLLHDSAAAAEQMKHWIDDAGTPREDLGIDLLRNVDSIHFLGGGYISQMWKANALLLTAAYQAKRRNPTLRLYATGLGLYPLEGIDKQLVSEALHIFDHASVRDKESAELTGIERLPDDAFLALADESWKDLEYPGRAFVCLQQDVVGKHPDAIRTITDSLLKSGISENEPLTIVEAIPPDDAWSAEQFENIWPSEVRVLPFTRLWNIGIPSNPDAVWISSRFHVHLLAAAAGAKGLALQFGNDYYNVKHQSLLDIGTGWDTLHIHDNVENMPHVATCNAQFTSIAARLSQQKMNEASLLYGSEQ